MPHLCRSSCPNATKNQMSNARPISEETVCRQTTPPSHPAREKKAAVCAGPSASTSDWDLSVSCLLSRRRLPLLSARSMSIAACLVVVGPHAFGWGRFELGYY